MGYIRGASMELLAPQAHRTVCEKAHGLAGTVGSWVMDGIKEGFSYTSPKYRITCAFSAFINKEWLTSNDSRVTLNCIGEWFPLISLPKWI